MANGGGQQSNNPMLNQLLALATEAQGDRPSDSNVAQMSDEVIIKYNFLYIYFFLNKI
jgi:hypothetical protein